MIARIAAGLLFRGTHPVHCASPAPGSDGRSGYWQCLPHLRWRAYRGVVSTTDLSAEIRDFLSTRRARITPEQAGLPAYGGNRRVKGLRREEVAMLAGVSVDYYVRMERGSLGGASESVLDALANALRLDEAERTHLFALAKESGAHGKPRSRPAPAAVRPAVQQMLDAMTDAAAWVRNGRHEILAMNQLARALYSPVLADPVVRPTPPASSTCTQTKPASSSSTTTASPTMPPPCFALRLAATRRTRPSSRWSVSCPPGPSSSASGGPPTM